MYRSATSTAFEVGGLVYLQEDAFHPWTRIDAVPDGFEHVGGCTPHSITFGTLQRTPIYLMYKWYSAMHTMDDEHVMMTLSHDTGSGLYRPAPPSDSAQDGAGEGQGSAA